MATDETLRFEPVAMPARLQCVFVHGRGQSPQDFAMLAQGLAEQGCRVTLPAAPGRVWYDARAVDPLTATTRGQLHAALDLVGGVIDKLRAEAPGLPLVLAGFSQGACVSLELAFRGRPRPDAVVALTGCRVGRAEDTRDRAALNGMPVILTGADADPWIPVTAFAEAVADLGQAGARLRAELYPGRPHEVGRPEARLLADLLAELGSLRTMPEGSPQ